MDIELLELEKEERLDIQFIKKSEEITTTVPKMGQLQTPYQLTSIAQRNYVALRQRIALFAYS